jgi:hypothetical protein
MSLSLDVNVLDEPSLLFGGEVARVSPKEGLIEGGPYDLRLGNAHRSQVRLALIGRQEDVEAMRSYLKRMEDGVSSDMSNRALFPDFPGFERVFRAKLARNPAWDHIIKDADVDRQLARPPAEGGFTGTVELWASAIEEIGRRELPVEIAICCIPKAVRDRVGTVEANLPEPQRKYLRKAQRLQASGQDSLFDWDFAASQTGEPRTVEDAADPRPEDLLSRNFRSALKARAMEANQPIQLVTEGLWSDQRGREDPATRAWNLGVALFYKAGGIPWRADLDVDGVCFAGISFHHLRTRDTHVVYSSLAQAFSSAGEGFALRGEAVPYDEQRKQPYLTADKARAIMKTVLDAYRERAGRDPVRLVVHKTTAFTDEERVGINEALRQIPKVQLVTLRGLHDFRLLRSSGTYPPHRGTLAQLGPAAFLFTVGYQAQHLTYPGPHVPVPLELVGVDEADTESVARDLLALTKMNWNSARSAAALPITLSFARKVGGVIAEIPPGVTEHPSFRYYM